MIKQVVVIDFIESAQKRKIIIDWCKNNLENYSFECYIRGEKDSLVKYEFIWEFTNTDDASLFALTWGNGL